MESLIERIRARASNPSTSVDEASSAAGGASAVPPIGPVVTTQYIADAENVLGFSMPPLLQILYTKVGNGGFGPGRGLYNMPTSPANEANSAVSRYLAHRQSNARSQWPTGLLPLCDWGHGIETCVDCTVLGWPVVRIDKNMPRADVPNRVPSSRRYENDGSVPDACWVESSTLERWLTDWADGKLLFYQAYGDPDDADEDDDDFDDDDPPS